jgi:hypothetical protein
MFVIVRVGRWTTTHDATVTYPSWVGTDVRTKSKEEAVRTQQETAGMEYLVRSTRKQMKRESSFWSSAARRKEADRVGFEKQIQKTKERRWRVAASSLRRERAREGEKQRQQSNTAWWLSWAKVPNSVGPYLMNRLWDPSFGQRY